MKRKLTVVLTQDEVDPKVVNVIVPALPGCYTWGYGRREALKHAKEAISAFLESMDDPEIILESETTEVEVSA